MLAVGPQLLSIQPNTGDLLESGDILNESPRELVFRFDDGAGIDPTTLDGIRVVRSGDDGVFERASRATDFGTGGATLVEFYATEPGESGNGIRIEFSAVSRSDTREPRVTVSGRTINVELNANPALNTRVEDILQAFDRDVDSAQTRLVYALRLRGSQTVGIGQTTDVSQPLILSGANAAKTSTNFGVGNNLEVRLVAREGGNNGIGISVSVSARDRGGPGAPIVTVDGKAINVELNSNPLHATTVQEFVDALNSSDTFASQLVEAQFVSGSAATRIGSAPITYSPLLLAGVTDIEIIPAYVGLGDSDREVVMRFSEPLPDDRYRIEILGQGIRTLRNVHGEAFDCGISRSVAFELNLGAQVAAVVPQPVSRDPSTGELSWTRTSEIDVYLSDDEMIDLKSIRTVNGLTVSQLTAERGTLYLQNSDTIVFQTGSGQTGVLDPSFYQLISTQGTLDTSDDSAPELPTRIRYYPEGHRVSLRFARDLDQYATGGGEVRLRVGTNESQPVAPESFDGLTTDASDQFGAAADLSANFTPGVGDKQSVIIDGKIENETPLLLDFPGGSDEPGNRQIRMQDNLRLGADTVDGTSVVFYNFQGQLGVLNGSTLLNAITETQKQRVREVMSLYEQYIGIRFIESDNLGMTIGVGDMRAISPFPDVVGGLTQGVAEQNQPGLTFFEAGSLISNGQPGTVLDIQDFSDASLNEFGGEFMRASMQAVGKLLGLGDADELEQMTIQSFASVFAPGVGTEIVLPGDADIVHGQYLYRPDSKDIDLYQFSLPIDGRMSIEAFAERMSSASLLDSQIRLFQETSGGWEEVAANDDYYSSDSYLELDLQQGNYIVGVSASGNASYDPTIGDTGIGGRSEGDYKLRLDFSPPADSVLRDGDSAQGTEFDGDADGTPGGVFDFWFRPSSTANTKFVDKAAAAGGDGSIGAPYKNIDDAFAAAAAGDTVRIVGNGGADGSFASQADNLAYEIGFDNLGRALPDGSTFDVPRDVSVVIDAGAILKLRRARVGVGSTSVSVDRSAGSLLVLGTPTLQTESGQVLKDADGEALAGSVFFTSLNHGGLGLNANSAVVGTTPTAGDWGGIDFRNRVDAGNESRENLEAEGLFLNWISHADVRYGGGQVVVDGLSQVVAPVQMIDARPTVINSTISNSADAALSATPNSFLESNFHSPAEQMGATQFTVDYSRVGPELHGLHLVNNSINGLQVRIKTPSEVEKLTVPGRFDDTGVVHYIPENLEIEGTAGGAIQAVAAPGTTSTTLRGQVGGTLVAGTYNYRFTSVDAAGNESPASVPTSSIETLATGSIVLSNVETSVRRIYRSADGGVGPYTLVGELPASVGTFVDSGADLGEVLDDSQVGALARTDARLVIDPGTVVKSQGARIDVHMGAQLIAEGNDGNKVVFTSLNDNRYGAGGTFDTANRVGSQEAAAGDWGGIYVGHTSKASLDHAVIAYGGGTTRVEGGFSDFGALEVHQGDLRLTNSRVELNADGATTSTDANRGGRGDNSAAAIFVRGAQPIIVGNIIQGNEGPAISANVSSLNHHSVEDTGRSTGHADRYEMGVGNHGPLVAGNLLANNEINGLLVRSGTLTTEGRWDDTDIVHVVDGEIQVPDHHAFGGLRLESDSNRSLVVKLGGDNAGFTATGLPLDNANRIGGSIQLVGQPGFPVILTSVSDNTVGAGFDLNGNVQTDTTNLIGTGILPTGPEVDRGTLIDNDVAAGVPGQFAFSAGAGGRSGFATVDGAGGGISAIGNSQPFVNTDAIFEFFNYIDVGADGQAIELGASTITLAPTLIAPDLVVSEGTLNGANGEIRWRVESRMDNGISKVFNTLILDSDNPLGTVQVINYLDEDVLGSTDDLLYTSGTPGEADFRAFTLDGPERIGFSHGGTYTATAGELENATYEGWAADQFRDLLNDIENAGASYSVAGQIDTGDLTPFVDPELGDAYGLGDITTAFAWRVDPSANSARVTSFLELVPRNPASLASAGDWRSVLLAPNSNDRNVAVVNEAESELASSPRSNETPNTAQYLGSLAKDLKSGDENHRLGFHIQAAVAAPGDVDVYSFNAEAGTEVWLDIDRTNNALDTVVELVDADGNTLALSDNSLDEEGNPGLLQVNGLPVESVNPLRSSPTELYYTSAQGTPKDLFSTNPKDAGLRVSLPGQPGTSNLYHVRVRSSSLADGDPASKLTDPAEVTSGLTKGNYQFQIRLTEVDEVPGSSVNYADIRFATTGLDLVGVPGNSPLLGENGEIELRDIDGDGIDDSNNVFANAQPLGNLLQTSLQAISVAGDLDTFNDVDWFSFDIDYERIRPSSIREYFATVLDVDYANGIGRPDVSMYVFDSAGNLILGGLGSNVVDDQASPLNAADNSDLSRGSAGSLDPYIGSYELPSGRYFVAITNSSQIPEVVAQFTDPNSGSPLARLQPIEGLQLIAEDHVNGGPSSALVPDLFVANEAIVDYSLGDVMLYVTQDIGVNTQVYAYNPFTGERQIFFANQAGDVEDIAFRDNGELRAFERSILTSAGADPDGLVNYIQIDTGTGVFARTGTTGLETFHQEGTVAAPTAVASDDGVHPEAITFATIGGQERGFFVGNRPTAANTPADQPGYFPGAGALPNVGTTRPGVDFFSNILYEFDENTGTAISVGQADKQGALQAQDAGTAVRERGYIDTGNPTGDPVDDPNRLVAVEATSSSAGQANLRIQDGAQFVLTDVSSGLNLALRFEFDFGPEALISYDIAAGQSVQDGDTFEIDGDIFEFDTDGVLNDAAANRITISATATEAEFINAISGAMLNDVVVSVDSGRINFSGANNADFGDLVTRGIFTDLGSSGAVNAGNIAIRALASDTAETIAARIAITINDLGITGVSANANGDEVQLFGATIQSGGPLGEAGGQAPGGLVTGIATVGNTMYAVSDNGGFYRLGNPTGGNHRVFNSANTYVADSYALRGIEFTGLALGPDPSLTGGVQVLFGIDSDGVLHAFDTNGQLQPVFANGESHVDTNLGSANGLAFSTLQANPWGITNRGDNTNREFDPGHGVPATPNDSRGSQIGESSYYFGDSTGAVNYDFPGGAAGALESVPFSLEGIGAADLPMLYFSYFLETENANGGNMRDAFRVYASGEDGQWQLLATNDSGNGRTPGQVQELFDNTGSWRQARVPLDVVAGLDNVKLRIEFSTGAGFGYGRTGGRGAEIRTIAGNRLVDGQSLVIEGQRFEIEMGLTITLPSGSALTDGDAIAIEGVRYVFTDGSGPAVAAPDVAVPFSANDSAETIAQALQTAIQGSTPNIPVVSGLSYTDESNDFMAAASASNITGDTVRVIGTGNIGDNIDLTTAGEDVDMVRMDLDAGSQVTVNVNASAIGSTLDSYVRIFDAEGNELASNDNRPGSSDSEVTFTAPATGTYFVGVSGAGNSDYLPAIEGTSSNGSTGDYELQIEVVRQLSPIADGNRVQLGGAANVSVDPGTPITVQGESGTNGVPLNITAAMTTQEVAEEIQRAVAEFFAGGDLDSYTIRGGDTIDMTGLTVTSAGPFGLTQAVVGDATGSFNRPERAQNNAFEGVYVDDFIIGIAGLGEMVVGPTGGSTNFVDNPEATNQILTGPYQFEIRGGQEYGIPGQTGITLVDRFTPSTRQAPGISIQFNDASRITAGETFTVSDGPRVVTFEMDDVNDGVGVAAGNVALPFNTNVVDPLTGGSRSESASIIAARFRDLLNSAAIQAQLDIAGNLLNNDRIGATSDTVVLIGNASVEIPSSIGTEIVSTGNGAQNRERTQGQIVISSTRVSNSEGFGASIAAAPRDAVTNAAIPGTPRNTVTLNGERLAPGAVIMNSEFLNNGAGGITVTGDTNAAGLPDAAVPFVRLVNNTILGGEVSTITSFSPVVFGGRVFDTGTLAFADGVTNYNPTAGGGPAPAAGLDDPTAAIGIPDFAGTGEPGAGEGAVSLGRGGRMTVEFTNNFLTGSGDANPDLAIFEVGDSEEVLVEVSADGNRFTTVGVASANNPFLDIDAAGFNTNSRLAFVRLSDIGVQGSQTGDSVGADIDAVGALSSVSADFYTPGGDGISIGQNSTATLLNNVIVNSNNGIVVDATSTSTIVGGTIFQRNSNDVAGSATLGQFPTVVADNVPLFVSAGNGNLYPSVSAPQIDSSIDSLEDRPALVAVKRPLGLSASPIMAPQVDINGQLRVDDPSVETPSGLGENVFKDRGAQDRADFVGPSVIMVNPLDNDLAGNDGNPEDSVVELTGASLRYFDIQLFDGLEPTDPTRGAGIDHLTVSSSSVLLFRNGEPLVEGVDYRFGYDSTNGVIRLTPLTGVWQSESAYTIRFINSNETSIVARTAAAYQDGDSFDIIDNTGSRTTIEIDLGFIVAIPTSDGINADVTDGDTFVIDDGGLQRTFEFDTNGVVALGNTRVALGGSLEPTRVAQAVVTAISGSGLSVTAAEVSPGRIQIQGGRLSSVDPQSSGLVVSGSPGVQAAFGLQIPLSAGEPAGVADGQTFTINRNGTPVVFELDTNGSVQPDTIPVRFVSGDSATSIGQAIVTAIDEAALGLSPTYVGNGQITLAGDANTQMDLSGTVLEQTGEPGVAQSIRVALPAGANVTSSDVADLIASTINAQNLPGVQAVPFGGRVIIEGALGVAGVGAGQISAITDEAGNPLKANQVDGSTTLTILLGEGLDYGDAPSPYISTSSQGGPRHTVVDGLSLGATVSADADAKLPDADNDDGLAFSTLFSTFQSNVDISVTNTTGDDAYVSLWVDFDGDGVFGSNANESILVSQVMTSDTQNFSFTVPTGLASGEIYARARVSTDSASISLPTGAAPDGEVEDVKLMLQSNPFQNPSNNLDTNRDGFVSPIDVLRVVNDLNTNGSRELAPPAAPAELFIDVNGDGSVSPIDVLQIVNFLNSLPAGGEGEGFGSYDVMGSDWAAGLETMLMPRPQASHASDEAIQSAIHDVALAEADSDDALGGLSGEGEQSVSAIDSFWANSDEADQPAIDGELSDSLIDDLLG
ncbi:MAG: hypothetical protein Aurels2KO_20950 [Aureliella sp.]